MNSDQQWRLRYSSRPGPFVFDAGPAVNTFPKEVTSARKPLGGGFSSGLPYIEPKSHEYVLVRIKYQYPVAVRSDMGDASSMEIGALEAVANI